MTFFQKLGLASGLISALIILTFINIDPEKPTLTFMAAIAILMSIWWITEAIPLAATSLIPLVLFPFLGILDAETTASSYINSIIFLFLGGFMLAIAMESWGFHKRIALRIILFFGGSPASIINGFLAATAFISMWISNTATAVMMLPIGIAIIQKMESRFNRDLTKNFSTSLMLSIAYASSIGGIATLIGTPTNLTLVRIYQIIFPEAPVISFGNWMLMALPISIILLVITGILLTKIVFKVDKKIFIEKTFIKDEYNKLGRISYEEKIVAFVFASTVLLWIFRAELNLGFITIPGWQNFLSLPQYITDGTVAITMALILFFIPSRQKKTILDVTVFNKIPWGIILLFGGGFALANGFTSTGLSEFIGSKFKVMTDVPPIIIVIISALVINFLTELTSNTATAQMILPIMASVSVALGLNPLLLMIVATLASSLGFMLPVGTPPNTIVFASERLKIFDMVRTGFALNIISIIVIIILVYFLGTLLFDLDNFPLWAKEK
jgi:sodium-dependent dicarboxylate transporter 2/3/5